MQSKTIIVLFLLVAFFAGCWQGPADPGLPASYIVSLPGGETVTAAIGSGASSLANTRWAGYRTRDDVLIAKFEFGPDGEVARFYENSVYFPEIIGPELIPDGTFRPNPFPFMTYAAASFGVSRDNEFGFAAPINVWIAGFKVATGVAYEAVRQL